jgi:[ribosomal protein S18]-alanine N-acetyltransferase
MIYRVRRMAAADVDAVMELAADLPTAPYWPREAYLAMLDPQRKPARIALVAEALEGGNSLAGFAFASLITPQAELESIVVATALQRRGIARRLFEVLADELAVAGVTEVLLEVRASNDAALSLYRALGFEETGRRTGYYAAPVEDAVQMGRGIV